MMMYPAIIVRPSRCCLGKNGREGDRFQTHRNGLSMLTDIEITTLAIAHDTRYVTMNIYNFFIHQTLSDSNNNKKDLERFEYDPRGCRNALNKNPVSAIPRFSKWRTYCKTRLAVTLTLK